MFYKGMYEHSYASLPGRASHKAKKVIKLGRLEAIHTTLKEKTLKMQADEKSKKRQEQIGARGNGGRGLNGGAGGCPD